MTWKEVSLGVAKWRVEVLSRTCGGGRGSSLLHLGGGFPLASSLTFLPPKAIFASAQLVKEEWSLGGSDARDWVEGEMSSDESFTHRMLSRH